MDDTRLVSLPVELLLGIFAFLEVTDVISVLRTCKHVNQLLANISTWLFLAEILEQRRPLPISASKELASFSIDELKALVQEAVRLDVNLRSANPQPKGFTRVLHVSPHDNAYWATILPGGKFMCLLSVNGIFSCWDLATGQKRAEYICGLGELVCWDFILVDSDVASIDSSLVIVFVYEPSEWADADRATLFALKTNLSTSHASVFEELYADNSGVTGFSHCFAGQDIIGGLVVKPSSSNGLPTLHIVVVDWKTGNRREVDTTLPPEPFTEAVTMTTSTRVILCICGALSCSTFSLSLNDLLEVTKQTDGTVAILAPSAHAAVTFLDDIPDLPGQEWAYRVRVPSTVRGRYPLSYISFSRVALENDNGDVDIDENSHWMHVLQHFFDPFTNEHQIDISRSFDLPVRERALLEPSSSGNYVVYINSDEMDEQSCMLVRFPRPGEVYNDPSDLVTQLQLPSTVPLDVVEAMAFDDVSGILLLATLMGDVFFFNY